MFATKIMSKVAEKEAQPSVDMEALQKKKLEDTTFADLVRISPMPTNCVDWLTTD